MDQAALDYCASVLATIYPEGVPTGLRVLEFGGLDSSGIQELFPEPAEYIVMSPVPGPSVTWVLDPADFVLGPSALYGASAAAYTYDVVTSHDYFEHTPRWAETLNVAKKALVENGLLLITVASAPREPHSASGDELGADEHYLNIDSPTLWNALDSYGFLSIHQSTVDIGNLYAYASAPAPPADWMTESELSALAALNDRLNDLETQVAELPEPPDPTLTAFMTMGAR